MGSLKITSVLMMLACAVLPAGSGAQTVFTEDFEFPVTGNFSTYSAGDTIVTASNKWAVTVNSVDLYNDLARLEAAAFDSSQAVDLTGSPGPGVIEASFATIPGGEYELVFHYARNDLLGASTGDAQVEVLGSGILLQTVIQHDPAGHAFDTYLEFQDTFTADSTEAMLRFTSLDPDVAGITIDGISINVLDVTGIDDPGPRDRGDIILRASPNPFRSEVTVEYVTTERGFVEVKIYDVRGRSIHTLVQGVQEAGPHSATWSGGSRTGSEVSSGIYFCVLSTQRGTSSHRVLLFE